MLKRLLCSTSTTLSRYDALPHQLHQVDDRDKMLTYIMQFRQKYALAWNESMFSADRDGTTGNNTGICMDRLAICAVKEDDMVADALRSISH